MASRWESQQALYFAQNDSQPLQQQSQHRYPLRQKALTQSTPVEQSDESEDSEEVVLRVRGPADSIIEKKLSKEGYVRST